MGRNVACNLKKYDDKKHSTTGVTPNGGKRDDNEFNVWLNIENKTEFNRKCTLLSVVFRKNL